MWDHVGLYFLIFPRDPPKNASESTLKSLDSCVGLPSVLRRLGKDKGQCAGHLASVPWRCDVILDACRIPWKSRYA